MDKTMNNLTIGTPYFRTRKDAIEYYKEHNFSYQNVDDKIYKEEIFIGPPEYDKLNEVLTCDEDGRYHIIKKELKYTTELLLMYVDNYVRIVICTKNNKRKVIEGFLMAYSKSIYFCGGLQFHKKDIQEINFEIIDDTKKEEDKDLVVDGDMETTGTTEWTAEKNAVLNRVEKDILHKQKMKEALDSSILYWFEGILVGKYDKDKEIKIRGGLQKYKEDDFAVTDTDTDARHIFSVDNIKEFTLDSKWPKEHLDKYSHYMRSTYTPCPPKYTYSFEKTNGEKMNDELNYTNMMRAYKEAKEIMEKQLGHTVQGVICNSETGEMFSPEKEEEKMAKIINCNDCEGLEEAKYKIEVAGCNKENTVIKTDGEGRKIVISVKSDEPKLDLCKEISVPGRYNLGEAKAVIKDGVITVTVPTNEGTVKTIKVS